MDGQQYACVSKNLAEGKGTFWKPWLSETWERNGSNYFLEHPPLVYALQAPFFKALGNSLYSERIYSLLSALLSMLLIHKIWQLIRHADTRNQSWLPVLIWSTIPLVYWSFQNNMHENTLSLFCIASTYLYLLYREREKIGYLIAAGFMIFCAVLSKGIPGLFPLALPFIDLIIRRNLSWLSAIKATLILLAVPAIIFLLLMLYEPAKSSLEFYAVERLFYRIQESHTVSSRFYLLERMWMALIPYLALLFLSLILRISRKESLRLDPWASFFLLLGFAASLPIMMTSVQRGFYLVPSFPYFAIAFAILLSDWLNPLYSGIRFYQKNQGLLRIVFSVLLLSSIGILICQAGSPGRDRDILSDCYAIGEIIPEGSTQCIQLEDEWSLTFYLLRYFDVSLYYGLNDCEYSIKYSDNNSNANATYSGQKYDLVKNP